MSSAQDKSLGYLLYRVTAQLRAQVTTTVLAPLSLAFPQYLCMRLLSHAEGLSNADLARALNVSPQATNVVVHGLIARGLVERPALTPSGRSLPITLTPEGARLLDSTNDGVHEAESRLMQKVSPQQRSELKQILAELS
jgi:DNA-binding MarR family transcriptional regulator